MNEGSPDYTRRSILYAWNGTAFVPVLVDEKGNIVSVFKGEYAETLQTVKVDSEGRIIALITDELDIYGNQVIIGNAELAARLGSEKFFDRRGDLYFVDNFEEGFGKWEVIGDGLGNKQVITADRARSGGYSAKLVGGSTTTYNALMYTSFPYPILSKWGFESHFAMGSDIDKYIIWFTKYTETQAAGARITYDRTNQKLQYGDTFGSDKDIETSFVLAQKPYLFHVLKLVVDLENNKYHRLILNDEEYDLSAHNMYTYTPGETERLLIQIVLYSRSGNNDYVCVDNVIVTQNEPD